VGLAIFTGGRRSVFLAYARVGFRGLGRPDSCLLPAGSCLLPASKEKVLKVARKKYRDGQREQRKMAAVIDQLNDFKRFRADILPELKKALDGGASPKQIRQLVQSYITARVANIALTDEDSGRALAAAKDLLDREEGRAVERSEQVHKFEKLREEEIDALLTSRLKELQDGDQEDGGDSPH
jgi:hypothetical protein